jgi:hypothetical protein
MTEDLERPRFIPELRKQASMLPDVTERELLGILRSAEFQSLGFPTDQMQFLRTEPNKFTLQIVADLFNEPLTTVHSALKRL